VCRPQLAFLLELYVKRLRYAERSGEDIFNDSGRCLLLADQEVRNASDGETY
jgi:hypothetical protein